MGFGAKVCFFETQHVAAQRLVCGLLVQKSLNFVVWIHQKTKPERERFAFYVEKELLLNSSAGDMRWAYVYKHQICRLILDV